MPNPPLPVHEELTKVKTFECDLNSRWKPAAFFQHLTETAALHVNELGCGFGVLAEHHLSWVHSRMKLQILRFPLVEEQVTIRTWPKAIQQKLFYVRDFEVLDGRQTCIAAATSYWLIIDTQTRHLVSQRQLQLEMPLLPERHGLDQLLEKIDPGNGLEERLRLRAAYSAVDLVGHVNNSCYVEWICDTFPIEMYREQQIDWIQINYDHEVLPNEAVSILSKPIDNTGAEWMIQGVNVSNGTQAFTARVLWKDK